MQSYKMQYFLNSGSSIFNTDLPMGIQYASAIEDSNGNIQTIARKTDYKKFQFQNEFIQFIYSNKKHC